MQFNLTELPNGDLYITVDDADRDEVIDLMASGDKTDLDILTEATEGYWTNGSYQPFDAAQANPFVGLTSAPCIAESMDYNDDGRAEVVGKFWFYEPYMIKSFIEEMMDNDGVVFTLAKGL